MTQEEWESYLKQVFPDEILGFIRPEEGIPTDLEFSTNFPQFISKDPVHHLKLNAFLRQLFSNDKQYQIWIDEIMSALEKQDFNIATQKLKGLMSAADKVKLDSIARGAEINQNAVSKIKVGDKTLSTTEKADTVEFAAGSNIALTVKDKILTIGINGIESGAEVNQNSFSVVQVGTNKITSTTKTDTLQIAAGKNISIITDVKNKKISIAVDGELGMSMLQRNKEYQIGDIAYSNLLPSWARLECVKAGTTANTDITTNTQTGQIITDGTATFIVDDIRDGHRVGNIILDHILRQGYVKANGAILQAADYPRLVQFVIDNNLSVSETDWQASMSGMYVYDDTAKTLRVPDLRGEFLRGLDDGRGVDISRILGASQSDAMRNFTGVINLGELIGGDAGGVFTKSNNSWAERTYHNSGGGYNTRFTLNPSRVVPTAAENRPHNIALIAQIKY